MPPRPRIPDDAPPSYNDAVAPQASSSSQPQGNTSNITPDKNHLGVPGARASAIPADRRRSMEDEHRSLPQGWVRTFDPSSKHHFYVDTKADPPRSIWTHPYDDEKYLATLSSEERERVEQESMGRGRPPSKADIMAEHTDEDDDEHHSGAYSSSSGAHGADELPPRPDGKGKSFGRKLKDKMTGTTHEQREELRKKRQEEEQRMYQQHLKVRDAMARAEETGQPQLIGKDKEGKDVYVEPSSYSGGSMGYNGGYGYNPYGSGIYSTPNARYIRPQAPYSRPYGYGYGGGYGVPLALGGGLLGGMLLGDMAFGGMGMGMGGMGMGMGGGGF